MLLAVEGGGFFSSSASGYSNGLSLLLLGQNNDEKHMKVGPWNQYQLVDQVSDNNLQLASCQDQPSRGCASFVCFRCASAGVDGQSPLKVGPNTQPQGVLLDGSAIERDKELSAVVEYDNNFSNISLKSSLKKPSQNMSQNISPTIKDDNEQKPLAEDGADLCAPTERRKVHWTDACGKELAEIREFELSEAGESDDEFISGNRKTCLCRIM